jgi:Collagen triple helix repeat (20 copies)
MKRLSGKLTYSNVISTLCLVLLLGGGTAYAAAQMLPKNSVGSKQIKKEAVTPAKLSMAAKATLTGAAGPQGKEGARGKEGPQGKEGSRGKEGPRGVEGPSGTALAYATIEAGGTLIAAQSKGIEASQILHPAAGVYCFSSIPAEATSAVATVYTSGETAAQSDQFAAVGFAPEGESPFWSECPSSSDPVRVSIWDVSAAGLANHEFTIWFEG